jgi:hypothetical protein
MKDAAAFATGALKDAVLAKATLEDGESIKDVLPVGEQAPSAKRTSFNVTQRRCCRHKAVVGSIKTFAIVFFLLLRSVK